MNPLVASGDGVLLSVHLQPGAKANRIEGLHGDALKIRISAPPVDDAANTALTSFLAKCCGVSRGAVTVVAGASSRRKRVRIEGVTEAETRLRLGLVRGAKDSGPGSRR